MSFESFDEKLVTIGILCFNAENSISNAINSAFLQSWNKKEVIVVDDCSDDNSVKEIKKNKYFNQIKYYRNSSNMGPAYSRNKVIKKANGDFICFMDDDDISEKKRIFDQVLSIYKAGYPNFKKIISICGIIRKYDSGFIKKMRPLGVFGEIPKGDLYLDYIFFNQRHKYVDYGFGAPTCAMLLTKECFQEAGLFDESLRRVEDLDITVRFAKKKFMFVGLNKFLVTQNATSGADKTPLLNLKSEIKLIKKNKKYLTRKGLYMYSRLWPLLRFYHFQKNYFYLIIIFFVISIRYPLRAIPHFINSGMNRLIHEFKIYRG